MKKLMFAIAAVAAGTVLADVTSANVVGYQNYGDLNKGGHTLTAPTFLQVSSPTNFTLADLKVTDYPPVIEVDEEEYEGGVGGGQIIVRTLTVGGTYGANQYYWIDDGETGPGWFKNAVGSAIPGGAASVKFNANQALWIYRSSGTDPDYGYKVVGSGAVNTEEVRYTTDKGGHTAIGNGTPVDLTLADLSITDYPPVIEVAEEEYEGGVGGGQIIVRTLTAGGIYGSDQYYWIDDGETGPGWFKNAVGSPITGGAKSVNIDAGKGLWVYRSSGTDSKYKYQLVIPGVDLKAK